MRRVVAALSPAFFALVLVLGALGCMNDPNGVVRVVVGPDGQRWMVVECEEKKDCWRAAGTWCPAGYVTANEGSDVSSSSVTQKVSTSTAMMIRCKATPKN
jgi:hypothetical protein